MLAAAQHSFVPGSAVAVAAALLILGGAVGKSAQVPLQTWLPDAMAGPSPVSALIHAATMVTAGVYLIARTNVLFTLAPDARLIVAIVGTVTLLLAGFSALVQHDLKRALAYSTISQIGYMFLALGVSGWEAGVFHFMTHAFFKALLFLAAGVIIEALADEHDIFKMGGLRARAARRVLDLHHRRRRPCGAALRHRRLLQQGPHHRHEPRLRGRQPVVLRRLARRRASSPRSTRSASSSSCSSASATPRSAGGRAGASWCRSTCWRRSRSSAASCGCRAG